MLTHLTNRSALALLAALWITTGCAVSVGPRADDGGSSADAIRNSDARGTACVFPSGRTCAAGSSCISDNSCATCVCTAAGEWGGCEGPAGCGDAGVHVDGGARQCRSSADCEGTTECAFERPGCGFSGVCTGVQNCLIPIEFCGCDGQTHRGGCSAPDQAYVSLGGCVPPREDSGSARICRSNADCARGSECLGAPGCGTVWTCHEAVPCTDDIVQYCGCDGRTFAGSGSCPGRQYASRGACDGPDAGSARSCRSAAGCLSGEECVFPQGCGREGTIGVCEPVMECFATQPFCGCNNVTYRSCRGTEPFQHPGACASADAGTPAFRCDQTTAVCTIPPPSCDFGMVPSVSGGCWGPCVPFFQCDTIACDPIARPRDPRCPINTFCNPSTGTCQIAEDG